MAPGQLATIDIFLSNGAVDDRGTVDDRFSGAALSGLSRRLQ
jgi:hypothetical protein